VAAYEKAADAADAPLRPLKYWWIKNDLGWPSEGSRFDSGFSGPHRNRLDGWSIHIFKVLNDIQEMILTLETQYSHLRSKLTILIFLYINLNIGNGTLFWKVMKSNANLIPPSHVAYDVLQILDRFHILAEIRGLIVLQIIFSSLVLKRESGYFTLRN